MGYRFAMFRSLWWNAVGTMYLLALMGLAGCGPHYPVRSAGEFTPISADNASALAGFYRNHDLAGPTSAWGLYLWYNLTNDSNCVVWFDPIHEPPSESSVSDIVQITVASAKELRVRRFVDGQEKNSVVVRGQFKDGYFYLDPQATAVSGMGVLNGVRVAEARLGVDRRSHLLLDGGGGAAAFFGPMPIVLAPASAQEVRSYRFERVASSNVLPLATVVPMMDAQMAATAQVVVRGTMTDALGPADRGWTSYRLVVMEVLKASREASIEVGQNLEVKAMSPTKGIATFYLLFDSGWKCYRLQGPMGDRGVSDAVVPPATMPGH